MIKLLSNIGGAIIEMFAEIWEYCKPMFVFLIITLAADVVFYVVSIIKHFWR